MKAAVQRGFEVAEMAQPLGGRAFWGLPGRQLPTALGQRARNGPQLFQAEGIYFECFVRFQKPHELWGPHKCQTNS